MGEFLAHSANLPDALRAGDGARVRELTRSRAAAQAALLGAAREPAGPRTSQDTLDKLQETLHAACVDDRVAETLRAGRLTGPLYRSGLEQIPDTAEQTTDTAGDAGPSSRNADRSRSEATRLHKELERAEQALRHAREAHAQAVARARAAESAAETAAAALESARRALQVARDADAQAQADLREAGEALQVAESDLAATGERHEHLRQQIERLDQDR